MSKILIERFNGTVFACLADQNKLLEYHIESEKSASIIGNIYKGKVVNVLGGMQAAFVNVGLERNAYLSVTDLPMEQLPIDENTIPMLQIKEGDEIMVQAMKENSGTKGARVTAIVSVAGRFLVYLPTFDFIGISHKIIDEARRETLAQAVNGFRPKGSGFIVRTAGEFATEEELNQEAAALISSFEKIKSAYEVASPGDIVYREGDLVTRMIRDVYTDDVDEIVVNDKKIYHRIAEISAMRGDSLIDKVRLFGNKEDVFHAYGLAKEVEKLTKNKVYMAGGSYLIIDHTEALTVIDVNTGKYIGKDNLEETVFKTNRLAAREIARQVRLRNISGIVLVDFIDMENEEHKAAVVEELREAVKADRIKCNVVGMTGLGLVEFTRKKTRKSVSSVLEKHCPHCEGSGYIHSDVYTIMRIRAEVLEKFAQGFATVVVEANASVVANIGKEADLSVFEEGADGKKLYLIPHRTYHEEEFTVRGEEGEPQNLPETAVSYQG